MRTKPFLILLTYPATCCAVIEVQIFEQILLSSRWPCESTTMLFIPLAPKVLTHPLLHLFFLFPFAFLTICVMASSPQTPLDLNLGLSINSSQSSSSSYPPLVAPPPSPVSDPASPMSVSAAPAPPASSSTVTSPLSFEQMANMWAYMDMKTLEARNVIAQMSDQQIIQYSTHLLAQVSIASGILGQRLNARSAEVEGLKAKVARLHAGVRSRAKEVKRRQQLENEGAARDEA